MRVALRCRGHPQVLLLIALGLSLGMACGGGHASAPSGSSPTALSAPVDTAAASSPTGSSPTASKVTPRHIVLSPGQPITTEGGVFYVDLETGATEGWELGIDIAPLAQVSPDGRYILYGQHQNLFDTTTGAVCELEGASGWATAFSPDGRYFLVQTPTGMEKRTSDSCGRESERLGVPLQGQGWVGGTWIHPGVAWSPDGEALVIWAYADPAPGQASGAQYVYLVSPELDKPTIVQVGDGRRASLPVAWSPDGRRFALASGTTLATVDLRGQALWSTVLPGSSLANVRWSPDGRFVSVHAFPLPEEIEGQVYPGRNDAVYVLDADTGAIRFRLWGASACWGEVWAADGHSLIVRGQRADDFGWFVVTADGASVRRLDAADAAFFVEPSPTNPRIAAFLGPHKYGDGQSGGVQGPLMVLDLEGGLATPIVDVSAEAEVPGWDPVHPLRRWLSDGRLVFFTGVEGHGGCEMGPRLPELEVQFPPFDAGG